ncbi:MAG TPA: nucleotidyl transferase AbiEii/AbiGii toxin family protein [Thermoanaerobaculia bacterium]|nr:nucleotidyl transferase AbiEii/AbiGii toxin family protein [Thermoanaerobaculia bacterium]
MASIRDEFAARGLEFAVCGGIAMAIHGFTRATEDLDLFVRPEEVEAIEAALEGLGYAIKSAPATVGAMNIRRVSKIDAAEDDNLAVDLLLVSPETSAVWNSREVVSWRDQPLPVVSREGLIALKRLRATSMDLVDIGRMETEGDDTSRPISLCIGRVAQLRNFCLSLGKAGRAARKKGQLSPLTPATSKVSSNR